MIVLGIETSCDETAVAVVDDARRILANRVLSQDVEHRPYGGVVPEIAARSHLAHLPGLMDLALEDAGLDLGQIDAIAATAGPGLIGGVFVGVLFAKALAAARGLPFIAVNHLEAHALTARLTDDVRFPYLLLLVSGGHSELIAVEGVGRYRPYGATIDDAVGEAFDKTAKLLALPYPGGPQIERLAKGGDASRFALPRPMLGRKELDFSFAGLKTAVRRHSEGLDDQGRADLAASFQAAVADILADRVARALIRFQAETKQAGPLVVAGGVASNLALRERLSSVAEAAGTRLVAPPPKLCTDNAAMIAWVGVERRLMGESDPLDFAARPRWPLVEMTAA